MLFDKDITKWIWFAQAAVPGSPNASKIMRYGDNITKIFESKYSYGEIDVPDYVIDALNNKNLDEAKRICDYCEQHDILPVHIFDNKFPPKLKNIQDHPVVLYMKGTIPDFKSYVLLTVVGTRECSEYGLETAYDICDGLARSGIIIVSGMAKGIDAAAATAALNANKFTIAVLGCGVDVIYPPENESLYYQIRNNGLLISEYPPLEGITKQTFPERNRIMSGMSDAVFVIEAGKDSGALITADRALYQGRKLYAVPGNINSPGSVGTNRLIQNGAKLITDANDIIAEHQFDAAHELVPVMKRDIERLKKEKEERKKKTTKKKTVFNLFSKKEKPARSLPSDKKEAYAPQPIKQEKQHYELLSSREKTVYNALGDEPLTVDNISQITNMKTSEVGSMLAILSIKELVERLPGDRYKRMKKG